MMFLYSSMFIIFGLFFVLFCDTTLAKCNKISFCTCIVPANEVKKLIDLVDKGILDKKLSHTLYIDLCANVPLEIKENEFQCTKQNGSLCATTSSTTELTDLGIVNQSNINLVSGYNDISISIVNPNSNLTVKTTVSCCTACTTQFVSDNITYHVPSGTINPCKKQITGGTISMGSTLVILLFVFSGLYFVGGAIALKLLRGATGWEMLPNHEFWCDLPSLIRDGITFTFNCCRADSYERI
ncbi:cation-dependent mannose-6-phosphate receptor [Vespula squamosa]|uniref:Cation-dependent mannose-6-phosphate receptor n=1 Tax=Vespula squamosa TaxID=30214 RepID=A0ABD1ZT22_VESSQ